MRRADRKMSLALFLLSLLFSAGLSHGQWLVATNRNSASFLNVPENPFRPDAAIQVIADEPRGFVLLYERGVERWDDTGHRVWSSRYLNDDFAKLECMTVDAQGNIYVAGKIAFVAELGGLGMTNNSAVPGPNGHVQAFIAKLNPQGQGVWYQLFEAAGPTIWSLAMDKDGGVVFAGRIGGLNQLGRFGSLRFSETVYSSAVAGKISSDGAPQWVRVYNQFTTNRSTCEANSIAVDDSGIYVSGIISFSIQFGSYQLQTSGNWIGKLGANGTEQWIRAAGGTASQGSRLMSRGGKVWLLLWRDRILQRWDAAGTLVTTIGVATSSERDTAQVRQLSLNKDGDPLIVGSSTGYSIVGTNLLSAGTSRPMLWFAQWTAAGDFVRGRILATTTNANPTTSQDTVGYSAFDCTPAGDLIVAGSFYPGMKFLEKPVAGPGGFAGSAFLARLVKPGYAPELKQQLVSSYEVDTGAALSLVILADGPPPLSYTWRRNGEPIPNFNTNLFRIPEATMADAGPYDVIVSNAHGEIVSSVCQVTIRPPFTISAHPQDRFVILSGEIAGTNIGLVALSASSLSDKTLSLHITNTTSPRFPLDGRFKVILSPSTYRIPGDGDLGAHAGSWIAGFPLGDQFFGSRLRRMTFSDGRLDGMLNLSAAGRFDFHLEIAGADGCCAVGEYALSGGANTAVFSVSTTRTVPNGQFQWYKNGNPIEGATASLLQLLSVTEIDAGLYHCVVTDRGYTEVSRAARLDVRTGTTSLPPALLDLKAITFTTSSMTVLSWPAGYVLQRTDTLSPASWQTIATVPPAVVEFQGPGGFLRLLAESP